MMLSIWRYSHLILAVSSFLFITVASLTGMALALEPVSVQMQGYQVAGAEEVTVAEAITAVKDQYLEVFSISVDANHLVELSAMDDEGNMANFYINPRTGEKVGDIARQSAFFEFMTSLHRSLFLKGLGRFFIGLAAFLLLLITITGIVLVAKRQQGIRRFFSSVIRENFFQYYHVLLGRLAIIPILIITLTGTYLSLQRFKVIPEGATPNPQVDFDALTDQPSLEIQDFAIFKSTPLSQLRTLEFPFSEEMEDYYRLSLKDREVLVNQFTGEVLAEAPYPMVTLLAELSLMLHTGRGGIWWALVLCMAAGGILFFIYSGFAMTFKRRATRMKNNFDKDHCRFIILVGSETGTTLPFAMQLHLHLLEQGETSYITELNRYTSFPSMEHLIIITSTYGDGEPPSNAGKFQELLEHSKPVKAFKYAVVGFGSLAYQQFCGYALEVDQWLKAAPGSTQLLAPHLINNRSWESYRQWARQYGEQTGISLELPAKNPEVLSRHQKLNFRVTDKTYASDHPDDTFLIRLRPEKPSGFTSGDLLAVFPAQDTHERLYSVASDGRGEILLSVKRHERGVCSNYLNNLSPGEWLEGSIVSNRQFHFPKNASSVICISTGTGIAPFLGMMTQNDRKIPLLLYWGARNEQSFALYQDTVRQELASGQLTRFVPAYSRSGSVRTYVQHLVLRDRELMARTLQEKGVIMLCGSVAMQREVIDVLEEAVMEINRRPLSYYQNRKQLRIDCY